MVPFLSRKHSDQVAVEPVAVVVLPPVEAVVLVDVVSLAVAAVKLIFS